MFDGASLPLPSTSVGSSPLSDPPGGMAKSGTAGTPVREIIMVAGPSGVWCNKEPLIISVCLAPWSFKRSSSVSGVTLAGPRGTNKGEGV